MNYRVWQGPGGGAGWRTAWGVKGAGGAGAGELFQVAGAKALRQDRAGQPEWLQLCEPEGEGVEAR